MLEDFISSLDWSSGELSDLVKSAQTFRRQWLEGKSPLTMSCRPAKRISRSQNRPQRTSKWTC